MLRLVILTLSIIVGVYALLFSGGYMQDTCESPIAYRIATIDKGFGIDRERAGQALRDATNAWESATGLDLFVDAADNNSKALLVNFVYDERQRETVAEKEARLQLENKKNKVESSEQSYSELEQTIESLEDELDSIVQAYEEKVDQYNRDIENNTMSYSEAQSRRQEIDQELVRIRHKENELNRVIVSINNIAQKSERYVESYNNLVENYNREFAGTSSFDQGDYTSDGIINIYQYESQQDLVVVLAHELGHALGIDHVEADNAVMNAVLEGQVLSQEIITQDDVQALSRVCAIL